MLFRFRILFAFLLLSLPSFVQAVPFVFISGSVKFSIRNAGLTVEGRFSGLSAQVRFDPDRPAAAKIEGHVETATLETGIALRDRHLKKAEYFNVQAHPQIAMKLISLVRSGQSYSGRFSLTLKGITRTLELPVEFERKEAGATLSTSFTLNRRDYGVGGSSWTMSDEVKVTVTFQLKAL